MSDPTITEPPARPRGNVRDDTDVSPFPGALLGRDREVDILTEIVEAARHGESRTVIVRGPPGVGKTALIDHVVAQVPEVRIARAAGVESEMELPFAALHQLCATMLDRLDVLPAPQADALSKIFGLSRGAAPDRFLVGLAALSLVAGLGAEQPLVCVVDDAQWLDQASAQTMAFVARRLLADPVAWVFAARDDVPTLEGMPELLLAGVDDGCAGALLDSALPAVLDTDVRDRILAEAHGNPLALLEVPRGLSPAELAGGMGFSGAMPIAVRIAEAFERRLEALPPASRSLMLVAAAEPVGDPVVIFRAAETLGLPRDAEAEAVADGLLTVGRRIAFRHPLVRSVSYRASTESERRRVHRALASATDADADPDRRAWHLAQSTSRPDDEIAAELERCAGRAQARSGYAAAAAFLERSAALTVDPAARAQRALAAAHAKHLSGDHGAALAALAAAEAGPLDESERSQANLLRAEIAYTERRGNDAPGLLLHAARSLEPLDPVAARSTYLDAFVAARFVGRLARDTDARAVALAVRAAPAPDGPPSPSDRLLDGLTTSYLDGFASGVPALQEVVHAFREGDVSLPDQLRSLSTTAHVAMSLWDEESHAVLSARHVELGRRSGLLAVMPTAMTGSIISHALRGQLTIADQLIRELEVLTETMEVPMPPYGPLVVSAWRGEEARAARERASALDQVTERGEGAAVAYADYALAVIANALGQYDVALAAASAIDAATEAFVVDGAGRVELVEAAVRSRASTAAHEALEQLSQFMQAADSPWATGLYLRSRALVSSDPVAEGLYRDAVACLAETEVRPQLARTHLLLGEWLRRQNRRVDARDELHTAFALLTEMGIDAFAERARRELLATGERVRRRTVETTTDLTAQEAHISRLAVEGHTNPEIGAQLFISPRTVEWHLRKVFTKLSIGSRRELRGRLQELGQLEPGG